jgi:hypothetical protein
LRLKHALQLRFKALYEGKAAQWTARTFVAAHPGGIFFLKVLGKAALPVPHLAQ